MADIGIRPNGDVKAGWAETPPGTAYTCIDEAVNYPTVPDTGDYISGTNGQVCTVDLGTGTLAGGESPRQAILRAYAETSGASFGVAVSTAGGKFVTSTAVSGAIGWYTNTSPDSKAIPALTQADIDTLQATISGPTSGTGKVYAVYLSLYMHKPSNMLLLGVG